jgi:hypothetical protein
MIAACYFFLSSSCFFAFLMGLPQQVHLVFSNHCGKPQRLLSQAIMSDFPQVSHFSLPMNVC